MPKCKQQYTCLYLKAEVFFWWRLVTFVIPKRSKPPWWKMDFLSPEHPPECDAVLDLQTKPKINKHLSSFYWSLFLEYSRCTSWTRGRETGDGKAEQRAVGRLHRLYLAWERLVGGPVWPGSRFTAQGHLTPVQGIVAHAWHLSEMRWCFTKYCTLMCGKVLKNLKNPIYKNKRLRLKCSYKQNSF